MTQVNTILGPVDSSTLGFTLMHEHLLTASLAMHHAFSMWIRREAVVEETVLHVQQAKDAGVQTLVDATPTNLEIRCFITRNRSLLSRDAFSLPSR